MDHVAAKGDMDLGAVAERGLLLGAQIDSGQDDDGILAGDIDVHVDGAAHELGDIHGGLNAALLSVGAENDVVRTDAEDDILGSGVLGLQSGLLILGQVDAGAVNGDEILLAVLVQTGIEEVHLGGADEAGHEQVGGAVKYLLRCTDLLDEAVTHDDDAVAQGHSLGLVVGNVDEGGVDLLAQLDDLSAHLVTELGVQVTEGLVHEEHLGLADDGAADGHTLTLAAGQSLGLTVEVLSDVQDLGGFLYLAVDLLLGHLLELQGEGHVLIHGHVGVQGVALEDHGDITVLGGHVIDQLAVDVQLAFGNLLQAGHHAQSGGLAAAGGADQDDELLILDIQVELLDRYDALVGDLKVNLLLLGGGFALLGLLGLLLVAAVGVDLLDVLQGNSCHVPDVSGSASAMPTSEKRSETAAPL